MSDEARNPNVTAYVVRDRGMTGGPTGERSVWGSPTRTAMGLLCCSMPCLSVGAWFSGSTKTSPRENHR